jgi:hypothetical protein
MNDCTRLRRERDETAHRLRLAEQEISRLQNQDEMFLRYKRWKNDARKLELRGQEQEAQIALLEQQLAQTQQQLTQTQAAAAAGASAAVPPAAVAPMSASAFPIVPGGLALVEVSPEGHAALSQSLLGLLQDPRLSSKMEPLVAALTRIVADVTSAVQERGHLREQVDQMGEQLRTTLDKLKESSDSAHQWYRACMDEQTITKQLQEQLTQMATNKACISAPGAIGARQSSIESAPLKSDMAAFAAAAAPAAAAAGASAPPSPGKENAVHPSLLKVYPPGSLSSSESGSPREDGREKKRKRADVALSVLPNSHPQPALEEEMPSLETLTGTPYVPPPASSQPHPFVADAVRSPTNTTLSGASDASALSSLHGGVPTPSSATSVGAGVFRALNLGSSSTNVPASAATRPMAPSSSSAAGRSSGGTLVPGKFARLKRTNVASQAQARNGGTSAVLTPNTSQPLATPPSAQMQE